MTMHSTKISIRTASLLLMENASRIVCPDPRTGKKLPIFLTRRPFKQCRLKPIMCQRR